ncbi:Flagellar protein FlgT [Vibrio cholerae]|nr:Flagellar protein FlgT [Vibrio cholerae]
MSRVYEHEAELTVDQPELAYSIQIGDVRPAAFLVRRDNVPTQKSPHTSR